jgi:transcriptional/translational regulatory protein YebC/TACO1
MAGSTGKAMQFYQAGQRMALFKDYEQMDSDAILASALDIYADESTLKSEYGDVLTIISDDEEVKEILYNLFYEIMNIEFNLWP